MVSEVRIIVWSSYLCSSDLLGYDPIWFGIIVVKMVEIGLITPPIGLNCFVVNGVRPDIPLSAIFMGVWPFVVADLICVGLLLVFAQIVLFLLLLMSSEERRVGNECGNRGNCRWAAEL